MLGLIPRFHYFPKNLWLCILCCKRCSHTRFPISFIVWTISISTHSVIGFPDFVELLPAFPPASFSLNPRHIQTYRFSADIAHWRKMLYPRPSYSLFNNRNITLHVTQLFHKLNPHYILSKRKTNKHFHSAIENHHFQVMKNAIIFIKCDAYVNSTRKFRRCRISETLIGMPETLSAAFLILRLWFTTESI